MAKQPTDCFALYKIILYYITSLGRTTNFYDTSCNIFTFTVIKCYTNKYYF